MDEQIVTTKEELAAVFLMWGKEWAESPDEFRDLAEAATDPEEFATETVTTLLRFLKKVRETNASNTNTIGTDVSHS